MISIHFEVLVFWFFSEIIKNLYVREIFWSVATNSQFQWLWLLQQLVASGLQLRLWFKTMPWVCQSPFYSASPLPPYFLQSVSTFSLIKALFNLDQVVLGWGLKHCFYPIISYFISSLIFGFCLFGPWFSSFFLTLCCISNNTLAIIRCINFGIEENFCTMFEKKLSCFFILVFWFLHFFFSFFHLIFSFRKVSKLDNDSFVTS